MATYTLAQLRTLAKQESDNTNQSFISDAEWNSYIQRSYGELYGLVVQAYGDDYYSVSPPSFTTDGTNDHYPTTGLPSDFFKLRGVDLQTQSTGQWVTLKQFEMPDRNMYSAFSNSVPPAGQVLRYFYTPLPTLPTVDADTIDGVNGWEEYVIVDVAIKALRKEEADVSALMMAKQALIQRLEAEAENRNSGAPHVITDTISRGAWGMRYKLDGNKLWIIGSQMPGWGLDWGGDTGGWR